MGKFAIIDDEDFEHLDDYRWRVDNKGYVRRTGNRNGTKVAVFMSHAVMRCPKGKQVDHIHGLKLDNRKSELRVCTGFENMRNRPRHRDAKGTFKGIWQQSHSRTWQARLTLRRRPYNLGTYRTEHAAALAYDFWATLLHGDFASTNFTVVSHWTNPNA